MGLRFRPALTAALIAALAVQGRADDTAGDWFIGGGGGIFALSPDNTIEIGDAQAQSAGYSADVGGGFQVFTGRHLNDILTVQGSYIWNRNTLTLNSASTQAGSTETTATAQLQSAIGEAMFYVRGRKRRLRPFLTFGGGVVRVTSRRFSASKPAIHFSVGVDYRWKNGWALRYMFNETVANGNPVSESLTLPGSRNLISFQNMFGIVREF